MDKACENRSHVFFGTGQNQKVSWWVNVASTAPIFQHESHVFFSDVCGTSSNPDLRNFWDPLDSSRYIFT